MNYLLNNVALYLSSNTLIFFFYNFWTSFWFEWFFLQTILLYLIYRVCRESNLLKLLIIITYMLITICVYLSLLQFELLACFLFLGEFVLIIFFYSFFLNLNYSFLPTDYQAKEGSFSQIDAYKLVYILGCLLILYVYFESYSIIYNISDLYILYKNLYKQYDNFVINDVLFIFDLFYSYHYMMFILVGVILLLLTFVLLYVMLCYIHLTHYRNEVFTFNIYNMLLKLPSIIREKRIKELLKNKHMSLIFRDERDLEQRRLQKKERERQHYDN